MRLDLRNIIHVPDAEKTFQYQMTCPDWTFGGRKPITRPVSVEGSVTNHAGALVLSGHGPLELDLVCDRGMGVFREMSSRWDSRAGSTSWRMRTARTISFCLTGTSWIWTRWSPRPSFSPWIQRTFAQKTAKGCAPSARRSTADRAWVQT